MQNVVGVRFKDAGKIYDFDPNGLEIKAGDLVIIDSDRGPGIGKVVREEYEADVVQPLKKVIRKASEDDLKRLEENEGLKKEACEFCRMKVKEMNLPMKLVCTELSFDGSKAIFYFTSEGRVDFRELVKDLAAKFKIRIEMKQIGVRDEARQIGGYGCCGRSLCCETFLKDFEPVSIRMAKKQELALNPAKISGVCGRLLCCLVFEYEIYDEIKKDTIELKNIEKSPYPEVDQDAEPSLDMSDSGETSTLISKTEGLEEVSLTNKQVEPPSHTFPLPEGEKDGSVDGFPKMYSGRRRRRRRRRKPEGNNPLEK